MIVSETLKRKRKEKGLTQGQLASISGVSQQAISFIECGRNTPSEGTLRLLAEALGCSIAELVGESDGQEKENTREETRLLAVVRRLNPAGVAKVIEYAEDLADNEKYTQDIHAAASAG